MGLFSYFIFFSTLPATAQGRLNNSIFTRPDWQPSIITATVRSTQEGILSPYCLRLPLRTRFSPARLDFPPIFLPLSPQKPAARGKALFNLSFWPAYIHTISYIYIRCILPSYIHTYTLAPSFITPPGTRLPTSLSEPGSGLDLTSITYFEEKRSHCVCARFSWPGISTRQ